MSGQSIKENPQANEEEVIIMPLMFDTFEKLDDRDHRLFTEIVKDFFGKITEQTPIQLDFEQFIKNSPSTLGFST
jgi:hypothetical protein